MNDRKPIYRDSSRRVISAANGLWVYQERRSAFHSKHRNDWVAANCPTTKDAALAQMNGNVAITTLAEKLEAFKPQIMPVRLAA